ncbi:MAG: hypothetical protein AABZ47_08790 [Planctomycetota bacterium]
MISPRAATHWSFKLRCMVIAIGLTSFSRGYAQGPENRGPHERDEMLRGDRGPGDELFPDRPDMWLDRRPPPFEMTEVERNQLREFIREHFPIISEELDRLRDRTPELYERRLRRIAPEMRRLFELVRSDPQRGLLMIQERKLDMQVRLIARRYHMARDDQERAELRFEVRKKAEQLFDLRRQRRELEIQELETRITDLRNRLKETALRREQVIDEDVREFLEQPPPGPFPRREPGRPPE